MRHARKINHLGRTDTHRKAMLSNMASSLILHKRIATTIAKAKALRTYVEPLITRSKEDTTHSRRTVFSYLQDKKAVSELFREVSAKIMERPGGYTRILRTGIRKGDAAEMCIIELVDYTENMLTTKDAKKTTTRRSRRGAGKKAGAVASVATSAKDIGAKTTTPTPVIEDATIVEDIPVVEDATIVEDTPAVEDATIVEEATVVEDAPVVEEAPVFEEPIVVEEVKNEAAETPEEIKTEAEDAPAAEETKE